MKKIAMLLPILFTLLSSPIFAYGQEVNSVARVGVFDTLCRDDHQKLLRESLREIGYAEGINLQLVNNCTKDNSNKRKERAAEMVRLKLDVIVARSTPGIRAVQRATRTVPIVMIKFGDPVFTKDVESFARPGGNITGVSGVREDYILKMLELLKEAFPKISRLALLKWHTQVYGEKIEEIAKPMGIDLLFTNVETLDTLDEIFVEMQRQKVDAIVVWGGAQLNRGRRKIINLGESSRSPVIYPSAIWAREGGLMAYGPNHREMYRQAVRQVHKILNGAKVGELPVERFAKGELVINLKTAERLGLKISPQTLMFADEVIR